MNPPVCERDHRPGLTAGVPARDWQQMPPTGDDRHLWAVRFTIEARVLAESLHVLAPRLEHVGSTAVPELAARPIIDIALAIDEPALLDAFVDRLRNFGYLPAAQAIDGVCERLLIRRERGAITHQVLVVARDARQWQALLRFRELLRADRELAVAYATLKRHLAARIPTAQDVYASGKAAFIARVLASAAGV